MSEVRPFFYKNDEFLEAQFAQALGVPHSKSVHEAYSELLAFTRALRFSEPRFSQALQKWLAILDNSSVHLGFEKFRNFSVAQDDGERLDTFRKEIDPSTFIDVLRTYSSQEFVAAGLDLKTAPDDWLKVYDVSLPGEPDPQEFKDKLFALSGFQPTPEARYVFERSKGGFFMMALYLKPIFCIGHGPVTSLFSLSTLAHEIGHTTTPRQLSLEKEFLEFPETVKGNIVFSNEDDSYLYECIFMQNASELVHTVGSLSPTDLRDRLIQRKAIQNNLHLLKNRMNYSYFSGLPLNEVADSFFFQMRQIYPAYQSESEFDWVKYATLDLPLSRLGYLEAYPKTFGKI